MPAALLCVSQVTTAVMAAYVVRITTESRNQVAMPPAESTCTYVNPVTRRPTSNAAMPNRRNAVDSTAMRRVFSP